MEYAPGKLELNQKNLSSNLVFSRIKGSLISSILAPLLA